MQGFYKGNNRLLLQRLGSSARSTWLKRQEHGQGQWRVEAEEPCIFTSNHVGEECSSGICDELTWEAIWGQLRGHRESCDLTCSGNLEEERQAGKPCWQRTRTFAASCPQMICVSLWTRTGQGQGKTEWHIHQASQGGKWFLIATSWGRQLPKWM